MLKPRLQVRRLSVQRSGILYAALAGLLWGCFPMYIKAVHGMPPLTLVAHRVVWTSVFCLIALLLTGAWKEVGSVLHQRARLLRTMAGGLVIAANWGFYLSAVFTDRLLEASLGYFINPLVNVLMGVVFLKERLRPLQVVAIAIAAMGVAYAGIQLHHFPWLALAMAFSFATYSLLHKLNTLSALVALTVETVSVLPMAVVFLGLSFGPGLATLFVEDRASALMTLGLGVATALPLLCFAKAAARLPLVTLGLCQFITPTCQLLVAVCVYNEAFTATHRVVFACVWSALILFTAESWRPQLTPRMQPN